MIWPDRLLPFVEEHGEEYVIRWGSKAINGKRAWLATTEDEFYRIELEMDVPF